MSSSTAGKKSISKEKKKLKKEKEQQADVSTI